MRKLWLLIFIVPWIEACCTLCKKDCCSTFDSSDQTITMSKLEIAIENLGMKMEGLLLAETVSPDADLLDAACQDESFAPWCKDIAGYQLQTKVVGKKVVLLLCDNKRALIEDNPCTTGPDFKAWKLDNAPCAFTFTEQQILDQCSQ
ncbi:MAG: hypothetical protein FWD46_08930 [Cystobacterineae bacterium]|nr:hypothetical protein [Cystobacterineae bacterium]